MDPVWLAWALDGLEPDDDSPEAALRSWEDRFGAALLQLGPGAVLRVLAERPPATIEAATALAAEHWAFGEASDSVQVIAAALIATPVWSFWWD